jgi:amylosucrase
MALLGEAIVAPREIMKYFGTENHKAQECDFAYHATQMALQWDALATGDIRVMMAAQRVILEKPFGTSWITYTRSHDDIGLGYGDEMIEEAGWNAFAHRNFLKNYYSGNFPGSPAIGALFSSNPKTGDARISGTLASLCGLEKAIRRKDEEAILQSVQKIWLMQAMSFFIGGMPMLFYGDELGYTNDYSYLEDPGKNYDNRWMHRPVMDWDRIKKIDVRGTTEDMVFHGTQKLLQIRKHCPALADLGNLVWLTPQSNHIASFTRSLPEQKLYGLFNFSGEKVLISWYLFKQQGDAPKQLFDHWKQVRYEVGEDEEYLILDPYSFCMLEAE